MTSQPSLTSWIFVKWQLSQLPTGAWLARLLLVGFGSVWALLVAVALLLER